MSAPNGAKGHMHKLHVGFKENSEEILSEKKSPSPTWGRVGAGEASEGSFQLRAGFPLPSPPPAWGRALERGNERHFFCGSCEFSIQLWPNGSVRAAKRAPQNMSLGSCVPLAPALTAWA